MMANHCQCVVGECQRGSGCWFAHGRDELRNPHKHASRQQVQLRALLAQLLPVVNVGAEKHSCFLLHPS